jgi:pimeloyl-ACP methyl ester carboxylesterase
MNAWHVLTRGGVRLACLDFGGEGQPVLLLHGLAGHAEEWTQTASWLTQRSRVIALDGRGHGRSERVPDDVSRAAQVADAAFVIERLELSSVLVVGHSLGALTALSLAAERPDLVHGLVIVDGSPVGGSEGADIAARDIGRALRQWPVPFASRAAAEEFFQERFGGRLAAVAWAAGLEQRDGGWWPRFDIDVMVSTLHAAVVKPSWDAWRRVSCPTLLVRSGDGYVEPDVAREMLERQPRARLAELTDAAHDVHLDKPEAWREVLSAFLDSLDDSAV